MKTKKKKKSPSHGRRFVVLLFLAALILLIPFTFGAGLARLTQVDRTTITAVGLPAQFDGFKILYVSDIDLVGFTTASGVARFFHRLEALEPDVLILGGDYANFPVLDRINGTGTEASLARKRRALFAALRSFDVPYGKFAVAGDNEKAAENLAAEMSLGGIALLSDSETYIEKDGARIAIVGLSDASAGKTDYGALSSQFSRSDYVIAVAHNPSSAAGILTAEAEDGGAWCDLILTGHTHGGQIVLFGQPIRPPAPGEARYSPGWHKVSGTWVLVSQGLGCEAANLRFGTSSQVHLISLRPGGP